MGTITAPGREIGFSSGRGAGTMMDRVPGEEHEQKNPDRYQPLRPAMLQGPTKRYIFKISQNQGWSHRQQRTPDIADDENKERDLHWRIPGPIHGHPGSDQEHRCADGADDIGQRRAN